MRLTDHIQDIENTGMKLSELALYTDGEVQIHRFREGDNCTNCYSVSKAFTMTALGMLFDAGLLDVKKPVAHYMASLIPSDADPAWEAVTVEHALTHTIGFGEGFLDIDAEDASEYPTDDYLGMVFRHPIRYAPGEHRQYSDAAFYLLSRLIYCISGERADDFLMRRLFGPMRFREAAWSRCPQGYAMGATGLYICARDMLKLPVLYLQNGVWEGRRLLSEEWVRTAVENGYELRPLASSGWVGKGGMYGQMIMFDREKRSAAAWLGHTTDGSAASRLISLLDRIIG